MAISFISERKEVSKVIVYGDYIVLVRYDHIGTYANGSDVLIGQMTEVLVPGTDLSGSDPETAWYCTDEVRGICEGHWDDESVAEWNAMSQAEKDEILNNELGPVQ